MSETSRGKYIPTNIPIHNKRVINRGYAAHHHLDPGVWKILFFNNFSTKLNLSYSFLISSFSSIVPFHFWFHFFMVRKVSNAIRVLSVIKHSVTNALWFSAMTREKIAFILITIAFDIILPRTLYMEMTWKSYISFADLTFGIKIIFVRLIEMSMTYILFHCQCHM